MHPSLLHQIADDRILERSRYHQPRGRGPRRPGPAARAWARARVGVGHLLISTGTRLAWTRAGVGRGALP